MPLFEESNSKREKFSFRILTIECLDAVGLLDRREPQSQAPNGQDEERMRVVQEGGEKYRGLVSLTSNTPPSAAKDAQTFKFDFSFID